MNIKYIDTGTLYEGLKGAVVNNSTRISQKNGIPYIEFTPFDEFDWVTLHFSTRDGGVSKGIYSSMNFSFDRGDDYENVYKNYELFLDTMNIKPENCVCTKQTHTTNVIAVDYNMAGMGLTRARNFAAKIGCGLAIIDKRRQKANVSEVMNIIGDAKGKRVILVDDMIDTAGTLCNAAEAIIEKGGAVDVTACATHAVLSGPAIDRIKKSPIKEVVLLDTVPIPEDKMLDKFTILPVAPVFAEAIERIYSDKPVSPINS